MFGAELSVPVIGNLLLIFGWLVTPLTFPVIGLAVLYFPTRAAVLDRHRWISGDRRRRGADARDQPARGAFLLGGRRAATARLVSAQAGSSTPRSPRAPPSTCSSSSRESTATGRTRCHRAPAHPAHGRLPVCRRCSRMPSRPVCRCSSSARRTDRGAAVAHRRVALQAVVLMPAVGAALCGGGHAHLQSTNRGAAGNAYALCPPDALGALRAADRRARVLAAQWSAISSLAGYRAGAAMVLRHFSSRRWRPWDSATGSRRSAGWTSRCFRERNDARESGVARQSRSATKPTARADRDSCSRRLIRRLAPGVDLRCSPVK